MADEFYTEPIVGFRTWGMSGSPVRLTGVVYTSVIWKPAEPSQAACMKMRGIFNHPSMIDKFGRPCLGAPNLACNDGFFGFYTMDLLNKSGLPFTHSMKTVRGTFQAWGKIILHEDGFRAEYVEPIAIIDETKETIMKWMPMAYMSVNEDKNKAFTQRKERISYLAENYNIPIVPVSDIEEFSSHYGTPPIL